MDSDHELMLEDARSLQGRLWRMDRPAQDAAEALDVRSRIRTLTGRRRPWRCARRWRGCKLSASRSARSWTSTSSGTPATWRWCERAFAAAPSIYARRRAHPLSRSGIRHEKSDLGSQRWCRAVCWSLASDHPNVLPRSLQDPPRISWPAALVRR